MTKYLHESYRTVKNDIEIRKHRKQRKISVHDESRTIMHIHKHKITNDKDSDRTSDERSDKIVTVLSSDTVYWKGACVCWSIWG